MAGRKSDFTLPKFDDIFSTQEMRDDEKLAKIRDIPLELIDNFPEHPYRVQDDEDMLHTEPPTIQELWVMLQVATSTILSVLKVQIKRKSTSLSVR